MRDLPRSRAPAVLLGLVAAVGCAAAPVELSREEAADAARPSGLGVAPSRPGEVWRIDAPLAAGLQQAEEAILVDVRTTRAFVSGHIQGAESIPYAETIRRLGDLPRDRLIITYCA